jgi:hypothetical protein
VTPSNLLSWTILVHFLVVIIVSGLDILVSFLLSEFTLVHIRREKSWGTCPSKIGDGKSKFVAPLDLVCTMTYGNIDVQIGTDYHKAYTCFSTWKRSLNKTHSLDCTLEVRTHVFLATLKHLNG